METVSIVTISYNQSPYIERCIQSVLSQSYPNIEYIIIDGGSSDGSAEIINAYRSKVARIVIEKDKGAADGLNKGFALATGEWLFFLNSDDEILPFAISDLVGAGIETGVDVISGHSLMVDAEGRLLRRLFSDAYTPSRSALGGAYLMQPSTLFRRAAYQATNGFNPENRVSWDTELWADMAAAGARFGVMDRFLSYYRMHPTSITASQKMAEAGTFERKRLFEKVFGRRWRSSDVCALFASRVLRHLRNPKGFFERAFYGRTYGRVD